MKLRIFSDPHIGVNRQANTSTASRKKIAERAAEVPKRLLQKGEAGICLGDMFDKYRADPGSMLSALSILDDCYLCLAGNHDTINDVDSVGSLAFLAHVAKGSVVTGNLGGVISAPYNTAYTRVLTQDRTTIYSIPHVTTQALFEQSLEQAYEKGQADSSKYKLLLLHCNYDYPEERLTSAELNLTKEDAEALIEDCGFTVLIGHMHTPASHFGGKLQIVGSTTNTGFADLSDKRSLIYDTETGVLESETHWKMADHTVSLDATALTLDDFESVPNQAEFITLTGEVKPDEVFFLSTLHQQCWERFPNLLALRDKTTLVAGELQVTSPEVTSPTETFSQFLQARMPDDAMKTLFKEVQNRAA